VPLRKATFALYPNATELPALDDTLALHCRVSNTLIEEHRRRYEAKEPSLTFNAMCRALTAWRERSEALESLNAQSLQVTANRVSLSFDAFFRRVACGDIPGYPRYKSLARFSGWGYKAHGDGWKLMGHASRYVRGKLQFARYTAVRLSGIGTVSMRGKMRFNGVPKTAEVFRKGKRYYLSVTCEVEQAAVAREGGTESMAFDWGLAQLLTQVVGDALQGEVCTVENPRWLKRKLELIASIQKGVSLLQERAKKASGLQKGFPVSCRLRALYARLRKVHGQIARQRHDFYHKLTAALVERFGLIVTEKLAVANMSRAPKPKQNEDGSYAPNGAAAKAGLNRSILDAAPAGLLQKLRYKAEEAGSKFVELSTRALKPTQRCCCCGRLHKMELAERTYRCECGNITGRDENAARTMLRYAFEGTWWELKTRAGTVQAAAGLVPS
jgi:putative transposase